MNLSQREEFLLAYFLSHEAGKITIDGRFARRVDFIKMFEDQLLSATENLSPEAAGRHSNIAAQLIDVLIEQKALTTTTDKYSGDYHQFDTPRYRTVIGELIRENPVLQSAGGSDSVNWRDEFSKLAQ